MESSDGFHLDSGARTSWQWPKRAISKVESIFIRVGGKDFRLYRTITDYKNILGSKTCVNNSFHFSVGEETCSVGSRNRFQWSKTLFAKFIGELNGPQSVLSRVSAL